VTAHSAPLPWDKQPRETSKAFDAFRIYRDLGANRSLPKVAQTLSKSLPQIKEWSARWNWVARASDWDAEQDRIDREKQREARNRVIERHQALGATITLQAFQRIRGDAAAGVEPLDPNRLLPRDVVRLAEVGVRIERAAYGLPTNSARAALLIEPVEVTRIVREIVGFALARIPEELQPAFLDDVQRLAT
jgi:hypothetical protein